MNNISVFSEELRETFLLHIPHSSSIIPSQFLKEYVNSFKLSAEIELLTDKYTEIMFSADNISKIIFPYSRLFCDVERLEDNEEIMAQKGMGYFYTNYEDGTVLRSSNENLKKQILNEYYAPHHKQLETMVEEKLQKHGFATIVDCHSFNDVPTTRDIDKTIPRPDICLGTDDFHTPKHILNHFYNHFTNLGYDVKINSPYKGTIIPLKFYRKDANVQSIMLEINKKLYENDLSKITKIKKEIDELFVF